MPGVIMTNGELEPGQPWHKQSAERDYGMDESAAPSVNGQTRERQDRAEITMNGQYTPHPDHSEDRSPRLDADGMIRAAMARSQSGDSPPEIEHITVGYQPLSKLIMRLSQETFNDLGEVIEAMSEMPVSQNWNGHVMPNHVNNHVAVNGDDDSPLNIQKKMRLMKFAQDRRAQFIKVLVLAQWSRQSQEISRVIDLKVWLDRQRYLYDEAWYWLGDLRRSLEPAKMPNPDLRTAMEVLSTGKASWLPDLGYIPRPPLTPQQMLNALREINILLSIRLNLHETPPPAFQSFTIASGRVTFTVLNEYEVDLSIADEDPTSQFFFIDLRFAFSPSSAELPPGRIRDAIEGRVNGILSTDGLQGCHDFLHELVLTQKIHILRRQAYEMSRDKWSEQLKLETVRRTLVVQYWVNKVGRKSWIEIGIASGKSKDKRARGTEQEICKIAMRWFPDGKEASSAPIALRLDRISMEATLKNVIALHATRILSSIRDRLLGIEIYARRKLSLQWTKSSVEPGDCTLKVQLTPSTIATLTIEPVTGRFALFPASARFVRTEIELNSLREPALEAHRYLSNLQCLWASEEIDSRARCVGWESWKTLTPKQEDLKRVFPRDTLRVSYFRRNGWRKNWIVAVSIGTSGEEWWIIELLEVRIGYAFGDFQRIPTTSTKGQALDPTYDFLSRLGRMAAGMISNYVNVRVLGRRNVPHALQHDSSSINHSDHVPALLIHFSSLMHQSTSRQWRPWAKDVVKVKCQSVSLAYGNIILVTEARLLMPMPQVELVKDRVEDDIAFHPQTGAVAFRLVVAVGEPVIEKLRERLMRIERLISFLNVVSRFNLTCETVSLSRIVFTYSAEHGYKADMGFAGGAPVSLTLAKANPHLRVKDFLIKLLNDSHVGGGLEQVTFLFGITLPLLLALDGIERRRRQAQDNVNANGGMVYVLPRAIDWYQIRYEQPQCTLDIRLRQRRDEVRWFVRENASKDVVGRHIRGPALAESLKTLMRTGRGEGWRGLRTGLVADLNGIAEVVRKLDDIMWEYAAVVPPSGEGGGAEHKPAAATTAQKKNNNNDNATIVVLE